jgi:hypothetical protein
MPTAFAPLLYQSKKKYGGGGGYNAARGLISRDIVKLISLFLSVFLNFLSFMPPLFSF